uniref:Uncharacterized protein n=1 Tax=Tanacetum cinerariifolium TaxID=118510 RepID=A0A699U2V3_TANCI|nr:hypothetical protein [Tanacetum cinerariifolium]
MVDHCDLGGIQEVVLLTVFPSSLAGAFEEGVANAARNYKILHKRDDDGAERPDKRQKSGEAVVTTTAEATTTTLATTTGVPVMGVTKETRVSSPTDLSILVSSSPGVPLRATPTRSVLRVDADT